VEVANPSDYAIKVEVAGGGNDGWLPVGVAEPRTTTTFEDVLDQGDTWTVRYSFGDHAVKQRSTSDALRDARWHLEVPEELVARLRAEKVPPSPRPTAA
jgi:hypothetical protein